MFKSPSCMRLIFEKGSRFPQIGQYGKRRLSFILIFRHRKEWREGEEERRRGDTSALFTIPSITIKTQEHTIKAETKTI